MNKMKKPSWVERLVFYCVLLIVCFHGLWNAPRDEQLRCIVAGIFAPIFTSGVLALLGVQAFILGATNPLRIAWWMAIYLVGIHTALFVNKNHCLEVIYGFYEVIEEILEYLKRLFKKKK